MTEAKEVFKMRYFMKIFLAIVFGIFLSAGISHAKIVTFEKEYPYQAGELDSKASCRTIALEMVKRLLLEELGTYLISETEVKDFKLTKEQIKTYSAGIVGAEIIEDKWDGKTYWLKAKVSADPIEAQKTLKKIVDDKFKAKELEESRKKAEELVKENERLKKELQAMAKAKNRNTKAEAKKVKEYEKTVKGLSAVEWFEKGYKYATRPTLDEIYGIVSSSETQKASKDKDFDMAIEAFTSAIALDPNYAHAYIGRGNAYADKGQYDRAIEDFNKAIALNPNDASAYNNRGYAYVSKGQYDRAIEDFNKVIALDPNLALAYFTRGLAYEYKGNMGRAISDFQKACDMGDELGCKNLEKALKNR
jgi:tetratricopeptide (TPR) repeat protein